MPSSPLVRESEESTLSLKSFSARGVPVFVLHCLTLHATAGPVHAAEQSMLRKIKTRLV